MNGKVTCLQVVKAARLRGGKTIGHEVYFNASYRDDKNPSVRINPDKDCWRDDAAGRGGNYWDLVAAICDCHPTDKATIKRWLQDHGLSNGNGSKPDQRIVSTYDYKNIDGKLVSQTVLYSPKTFKQRRPDGQGGWIWNVTGVNLVPYRLTEWNRMAALIVTEGEKHADLLWSWGISATTNPMGALKWREVYNKHFEDKNVVILPDNDDVGRKHGRDVARNLLTVATAVKLVELPGLAEKGDIVDWAEAGHTKEELFELIKQTDLLTADSIPEDGHTSEAAEERWSEPCPIKTELLPVPVLPPAVIPEPFRDWLTDIADRLQCPFDFVVTAAIVMVGSVIGAGCGIRPKRRDDWLVIPNLWGAAVGRPSIVLKTPSLNEAMKPLVLMEAKAKEQFDEATREHEADIEMFRANKGAVRDDMKSAAKKKEGAEDQGSLKRRFADMIEPDAPTWRRHKTNDATIEKMSELLSENPRGMLLFRDELTGLLQSWDKDGRETDRAFYLEAWNGYGDHHSDRIGRGTTYTKNLCVSIFGGIQPARLAAYLYGALKGNDNDGLVQRIQLLTYPDEPKTWKLIDRTPDIAARERAYSVVERLAEANFTEWGGGFQ